MSDTVDFYQENCRRYHERTFSVDPASFLDPMIKHLTPGAGVLDVGCGSGRDLKWLKERGFAVTGFERSRGLAALARENAGCSVIEGDFEIYDFSLLQTDALLLCGALVHVPRERFEPVLANILHALKPGGKLLMSLKQGTGSFVGEDGRTFYNWQQPELEAVFAKHGLSVLEFHTNISMVNQRDIWLSYVLLSN